MDTEIPTCGCSKWEQHKNERFNEYMYFSVSFSAKLPVDIQPLLDICYLAQGCILLLHLKHHLKETYGFSDR